MNEQKGCRAAIFGHRQDRVGLPPLAVCIVAANAQARLGARVGAPIPAGLPGPSNDAEARAAVGRCNELTAIRKDSPQPAWQAPLPVPARRLPAEATDLQADVLSTAPLVVVVGGEIDIASARGCGTGRWMRYAGTGRGYPSTSAA
jgi:hypothetical protein